MYDLAIIGAGPAGYSASIYASRYKVNNAIIADSFGGVAATAHLIGNWPGDQAIDGATLMQRFQDHASSLGTPLVMKSITSMVNQGDKFAMSGSDEEVIEAKTVLLATGASHRKLNIKGEQEFYGKGISYCFTCDGFFFRNKIVTVVGGGNSAAHAVLYLSKIATQVYLIYRGTELKAEPHLVELINNDPKITVIYETNILEALGEMKLSTLKLDKPYNDSELLSTDGLFIEIGSVPSTKLAQDLGVELDEQGLIKVNEKMETNIPGVYAAGDITTGSNKFRQIVTAAAEGAIAATSIFSYLRQRK